ncbi:hypothetical protein T4D_4160 [Trichinella pseudospiralis]|uniref:DUF5641 domain-containing protein n=1 Tax=Trichinella pseudospiralis TaxID=6337 RepID=A0A0V1FY63_TRIPS|nr:hypothetical protein T4D_4160 [Trichinella pseudospiralis]
MEPLYHSVGLRCQLDTERSGEFSPQSALELPALVGGDDARDSESTEGPKLNDLVLILEDNVPRGRCPLGVVVELFPGADGVARSARLRTTAAEMTRPVSKLVVLEPAHVSDGRTSSPSGGEDVPYATSPTPSA